MKRIGILFLSFILCMPIVARGEGVSLINNLEDADRISNMPIFQGVNDISDFFEQELEIIEERVRQDNPKLVESAANDSDTVKIIKYNNWYAQKVFEEYRDFFIWRLRQKSDKTGREIKYSVNPGVQNKYWLDRGELDTEKCNEEGTYRPKDTSQEEIEKQLADQREHVCLYPDGFEEYLVVLHGDDIDMTDDIGSVSKQILVEEDSKQDGWHASFDMWLSTDWAIRTDDGVYSRRAYITIKYYLYDYKEYREYKNQQMQDIKDGMFSFIPKEKRKCDTLYNCPLVGVEDMRKWKARLPDGYVAQVSAAQKTYVTK